jgi:Fe-S cluster biogenesis protein NfuA/nitrite reductase/ring-hydroxylating ferredoxin subunit
MEFDQAVAQLSTIVETLEREEDERAMLLLQLIDAVHRPGIEQLAEGRLEEPAAAALLAMYGLAPVDERVEAEEALDEIRPYIESHNGALELVDVHDGVVSVRMSGACNGCAASAMTLKRGIEEKLRERLDWFKEVVAVESEDDEAEEAAVGAVTLPLLQIAPLRRPVFVEAGALDDLPEGTMKAVDVNGNSVLVLNLDGEPYAFANVCPAQGGRLPLAGGRLTSGVIVCPWHNCAYDARSGKRVDDAPDEPSLAVLPIAISDGILQVAASAV